MLFRSIRAYALASLICSTTGTMLRRSALLSIDMKALISANAYCFHDANASLNAFSPGVPFSIARMARRLLL